jgi:hypothetical protein
MTLSSSPERGSFTIKMYKKKLEENPNDEAASQMLLFHESHRQSLKDREQAEEWQRNSMEYDLRATNWILQKVRESDSYAQNLYAAMCNNVFMKNEVFPILKEDSWGCSWRYAGGIIADMRGEGDYIDWYCSGIGPETPGYITEGVVTNEIKEDLLRLGWITLENDEV